MSRRLLATPPDRGNERRPFARVAEKWQRHDGGGQYRLAGAAFEEQRPICLKGARVVAPPRRRRVFLSARAVERAHDVCSDGQQAAKVCAVACPPGTSAWVASVSVARCRTRANPDMREGRVTVCRRARRVLWLRQWLERF
ncbi:hypothetical protein MTO96_013099 [Rhipicephalus appendiculatus]